MPEKGFSEALTKDFLEKLVAKILGKHVEVTSPEMGATAEGMKRLYRGEFQGDKANRDSGQVFTNSLPEAIRYMGNLGEPGPESRVSAVDVPEEIWNKSNNSMRQAGGRMGMRDALEANVDPAETARIPKSEEGEPNHAFPIMKNARENNMHFLVRKLANRKQQIIPSALAAFAASQGMTPEGFQQEGSPQEQKFRAEHPYKAEISDQLKEAIPMVPVMEAAGAIGPLRKAIEFLGLAGGGAALGDLATKSVNFENDTGGIDPEMAAMMRKYGVKPRGPAPVTETKAKFQLPEISISDALGLLGGITGGLSLGERTAVDALKQRKTTAANAKERLPSVGPRDYQGKTYPQIDIKDLKDIGNEPYPSGGNANAPFKPNVGSMEQVTIPGSEIKQAPQARTYAQPQGMNFKGANLQFNPKMTQHNVDKVGTFGDMSPATQTIPSRTTFQNKGGSQPGELENILGALDQDKDAFSKRVEAKRAEEAANVKPTKPKSAREQILEQMRQHPVISTGAGIATTYFLERVLDRIFGGRR